MFSKHGSFFAFLFCAIGLECLIAGHAMAQATEPRMVITEQARAYAGMLSDEEKFIRQTYMKLRFYNKVANANRVRDTRGVHDPNEDIWFEINDVQTGPIADILDRRYSDLVTRPVGRIIRITPEVRSTGRRPDESVIYKAQWTNGQYASIEDWENSTLGDVLRLGGAEYADIGKYTSYAVRVRLSGDERSYRALVLYHTPLQSQARPRTEFLDLVVGMGNILSHLAVENRTPTDGIRRVSMLQRPGRGDRQPALQIVRSDEGGELNFSSLDCDPTMQVCCNYYTGECCWNSIYTPIPALYPVCEGTQLPGWGDSGNDIYRGGLPAPLCQARQVQGVEKFDETYDEQYHWLGRHSVRSRLTPFCEYYENCQVNCSYDIGEISTAEYGITSSFMHAINHKQEVADDGTSNGLTDKVTCSGAVGAGVKACPFGLCTVTITISKDPIGLTVSSDGFWTYENSSSWTCGLATRAY